MATDLGDLVAQARRAGLEVSVVATDTVIHDPSVSIATYRIVQEALANVARYAGPAPLHCGTGPGRRRAGDHRDR
ncbi:sensor histidine kinase [Nigerium massiliense]|uniref:hypothetical protein n=1 Tax=Nigerium massiliense TaxID=1522317 RepID=UPI001C4918F8|nr:hypothetical protein [Nigerium massiliense]